MYAEEVLKVYRPGDIIWIHDYHLMLLPEMLRRELGEDASIGFFLHIPFPSSEIFKLLPWRTEILQGILGADLVGFHSYDYVRHFLSAVRSLLGLENALGRIRFNGRIVLVDAFPMGIDFDGFTSALARDEVREKKRKYERIFEGLHLILSVDRLDYTKGIPQRLKAYRVFLEKNPDYIGKIVLVLLVSPSRTGVREYVKLKREIDKLVGEINGKFSTLNWNPIVYIYKYVPSEDLLALYQVADIALITPLRDGMNLVAKEYVAAKADGNGVLILSENAGAAEELVEAIIVNPNDVNEIAAAIREALKMSKKEKAERMHSMRERVRKYNVHRWADDFLKRLLHVKNEQEKLKARVLSSNALEELAEKFCRAENKLLLLDYDGTLVPIRDAPDKSEPDKELLQILSKLASLPGVEVVVISGRDRGTLSRWFNGLDITLVAEHGAWIKRRRGEWTLIEPVSAEWKKEVRRILEMYVERTPGSFIEEKDYSIAWHYRRVRTDLGEARAKELKDVLLSLLASFNLDVLEGKKVIEIRSAGIGKDRAVLRLIQEGKWDAILAIGDDKTDEEMFAALPPKAYTIRVGLEPSNARYNLRNHVEVRKLLEAIIQACEEKNENES
ncbi:bifunctional alpha,alpha-trehalose-phosphate synthase (UDP-forming)/trehalose-phosphatase [Stetteria hydrogenophila]